MRFGWVWERWSTGENVQNGRYTLFLFGIAVMRTPSIFLGIWEDS